MILIDGNEHYKYYILNIIFKMFFAVAFGSVYMFYYKGGDTMAYWSGAEKLNNLFWDSPVNYFIEMTSTPGKGLYLLRFNSDTGFPPGWIYREPDSFFVSKILSLGMIFLGQGYFILTLFLSYLSAIASWKIYDLIRYYKITSDWMGAISILFIPSVAFWCGGISKDTIVFLCLFLLVHYLFAHVNGRSKGGFRTLILLILLFTVLFHTRSFMVFAVLGTMLIAMSTRILRKYRDSVFLMNAVRFLIITMSLGSFVLLLELQGEEIGKVTQKYVDEAAVQQADFVNNLTYGTKRYDLGITDYTSSGMLKKAPAAIFTAMYRPGIWEARSPLLLISGLETSVFIFLTLLFIFKGNVITKINFIRSNELLVFSLLFTLILAFFAGFTSGLFGVLVRFKAPLLPFLLLILTTKANNQIEFKSDESDESDELK